MANTLLLVISVVFGLSLVGAIVLFKFLKSSAMIKRKEYQAGGALAGFLLIFTTLYFSYSNLHKQAANHIAEWTMVGQVHLVDSNSNNANVEVSLYPPTPQALSVSGGAFRIRDVKYNPNEPLELIVRFDGYDPQALLVDARVARFDPATRRIELTQPVELRASAVSSSSQDSTPSVDAVAAVVLDELESHDVTTVSSIEERPRLVRPVTGVTSAITSADSDAAASMLQGLVLKFINQHSPLASARIEILEKGSEKVVGRAYSSNTGSYQISDLKAGEYLIRVTFGRQALKVIAPRSGLVTVGTDETKRLNITVSS